MTARAQPLGRGEFITLMAMLVAVTAYSIDSMLPAFPEIARELTPGAPNRAQLIISAFVLGLGTGTLIVGPLADAFGRRIVIFWAAGVYIFASFLAWKAQSLEMLLTARAIQGLGAAGPRIVTLAIVRDLYAGRDMARILSFIFMIFTLVPAMAPTIGHLIIEGFGWRAVFLSFIVFSLIASAWLFVRQPETLRTEDRRKLDPKSILDATRQVFVPQATRLSIIAQTMTFGILFTALQSIQPVFDTTFDRGDTFHYWFAGIALVGMTSSGLNAFLVSRAGMRAILRTCFVIYIIAGCTLVLVYPMIMSDLWRFGVFVVFVQISFYLAGLTIGNLNALALEPLGNIAGTASSIIAAISTIGGILIAIPIGLAFDGTPLPWGYGVVVCGIVGFLACRKIKRPGEL